MTSLDRAGALDEPVAIDVRLLGAVTVSVAGRQIDPGPRQQQLLTASLFAAPGRLVTNERLIDQIWDETPPATTRTLLHDLISALRKALKAADPHAGALVERGNGGYVVKVAPDQVDMHRFGSHLDRAQALTRQEDFARAAQQYRAAIEQWGSADLVQPGESLAGLSGRWAAGVRDSLAAHYDTALIGLLEAELRLGRHIPAIPVLQRVTGLYPDNEYATGLEMVALYRADRPSDALASYQRLRTRLKTYHGTEPSRKVQRLQQQILTGETDLGLPVVELRPGAADDRQADSTTTDGAEGETGTDSSAQRSEQQSAAQNVTTIGTVTGASGSAKSHSAADHRSGGVYVTGGSIKARDIAGRDMLTERQRRTP